MNRYLVGSDGKTPYERRRGKKSKMLGFEFDEIVIFRRIPLSGRMGKLESPWTRGIMIGYRSFSAEYILARADGVFKTRTIRHRDRTRSSWTQ